MGTLTKDILNDLTSLDAEALQALRDRADFLLDHANETQTEGLEEELYHHIRTVLIDNHFPCPPWARFKTTSLIKRYRQACEAIEPFIDAIDGTRVERTATLNLCLTLVINYLIDRHVPVSIKTIVQNLEKVPELVELSFPGYLQAGIFPWIVSRLSKQS